MLPKDKLGVCLLDFILWLYFEGLKPKHVGQLKLLSSLQVLPEFLQAFGTFSLEAGEVALETSTLLLSVCFMEKSFFSQLQGKGYLKTQHKFQAVHNKGHTSIDRVKVNIKQQLDWTLQTLRVLPKVKVEAFSHRESDSQLLEIF